MQREAAAAAQEVGSLPASSQPPPGSEWDYVTVAEGSVVAQHYVRAVSEADMCMPLVCPTLLPSFEGLTQQQMLLVYGAVEVMAPDIAAFARKLEQQGVALPAHAEPNEPHVYCVLPFKRVIRKGAQVIVPYIASCATQACLAR
jgi:acetyl esterase/lipase